MTSRLHSFYPFFATPAIGDDPVRGVAGCRFCSPTYWDERAWSDSLVSGRRQYVYFSRNPDVRVSVDGKFKYIGSLPFAIDKVAGGYLYIFVQANAEKHIRIVPGFSLHDELRQQKSASALRTQSLQRCGASFFSVFARATIRHPPALFCQTSIHAASKASGTSAPSAWR